MPFATKTDRDVQHLRKLTAIDQEQIGSDHYTILGAIGSAAESVLHELDALNSALSGSPPGSSPIAQSRTALAKILLDRDSLLDPTFKAYTSTLHRVADAFVEQIRTVRDSYGTIVGGMLNFFNGTFLEHFSATITSNGSVITMAIEKDGGGDLTMVFSDGQTTFDATPAATIVLVAGSNTAPQSNYIYIPKSTKSLTQDSTGWPPEEHIRVAYFLVQSAATVQANGPLINQNWNDGTHTNDQGHLSGIGNRIRHDRAIYESGIDWAITITPGTPDVVDLALTAGLLFQMHQHTQPAFDTASGDIIHVVNDNSTPYLPVTDLADLLTDSTGSSMSGKYFNLVIWGVANKTGSFSPIFCNLPGGSYNKLTDAQADVSGYDTFAMPSAFTVDSSTGFLIARFTFRHQASGGGDWTHESTVDLRGLQPATAAGSGTGSTQTEFADNQFKLFDESDTTKLAEFQLSGLTTGTTRTLTVPDLNGTLMLNVVEDTSPQLGGILDTNGNNITFADGVVAAFGTSIDALIYYDDTDLILDPNVVGSGIVKIGATGDDNLQCNAVGLGGSIPSSEQILTLAATGTAFQTAVSGTLTYMGSSVVVRGLDYTVKFQGTSASDWRVEGAIATVLLQANLDDLDGDLAGHKGVASVFFNQTTSTAKTLNVWGLHGVSDTGASTYGANVTLNTASVYGEAPGAAGGGAGKENIWCGLFDGDVQITAANKLILDGSIMAKGNTYLLYDTDHLEFWLDGTERFDLTSVGATVVGTLTLDGLTATADLDIGPFDIRAAGLRADADAGGIADTVTYVNSTTPIPGFGNDATLGVSPGVTAQSQWLNVYIGATKYYIPVWT